MNGDAQTEAVRVGVGVIIVRDGHVLLGRRAGAHGAGTWALPGGHLEFGETVSECAQREALEETGLALHNVSPAPYTCNVFADNGRHYVTLFVVALASGEPAALEPEKCQGWQWFLWNDLPQPLFEPLRSLHNSGFVPSGATGSRTTSSLPTPLRASHRVLHKAIGLLVLLPSTLVALFWTMLGVAALFDGIQRDGVSGIAGVQIGFGLVLAAGWWGLATLWRLYRVFETAQGPDRPGIHWLGLAAGTTASLYLLIEIPGQWLAAWPLIAASYFAWRLRAAGVARRGRSD